MTAPSSRTARPATPSRRNGFVLGYDQPLDGRWLAGGALGYSRSWWNATSGSPASGQLDSPQAGVYARYAPLKRNALTLGATVSGQFTRSVSGYLDANYEYRGAGQDAHRVTAGVRVSF